MSTLAINPDVNIVWKPIPHTSQELALDSRAHHTLYTGSRGPGKSDCQLMRFRRRVGVGYGRFWRGIIFDREYKHLDDLVSKSKHWFNRFEDGAKFLESPVSYKWVWPTGEELLFRCVKVADDYNNYHGQEYPYEGWNELTKYPTPELYDMMMSCNRSSFTPEKDGPRDSRGVLTCYRCRIPEDRHERCDHDFELIQSIPLEVFSTTNSYGAGHHWVKNRFIDVAPYGEIVRHDFKVFDPKTKETVTVTRTQVAIFGSYKENIYLDKLYVAGLASDMDDNRRRSWLEGDWDVVAGGALDDCWRKAVHEIPRFKLPREWRLDRSFDWGSSHPFSVGWWAEANGEEIKLGVCAYCGYGPILCNGEKNRDHKFTEKVFCPARGSLIQFAEWYGTKELGTNVGVKMAAGDIAEGIKQREIELMQAGWISTQPWAGPADNQIRDVREKDVDTIEKKMADKGIRWTNSDKSPGSRKNGLELVRERLLAAIKGEGPALYFMVNCRASIATLPVLERDKVHIDDVDTDSEDHPYDMVRYRVLRGSNRFATNIPVKFSKAG